MVVSRFRSTVIASLAVVSMFACVNEQVLEPTVSNTSARIAADETDFTIMRGHYILMASGDQLPASLADDIAKAKGRLGTVMGKVGVATATSDDPDFIAKASRIPGIQAVMPDVSAQWVKPGKEVDFEEAADAQGINPPTSANSNPRFNLQWGHDAIDAPEAWQTGHKGAGVRVAVLDSGFDLDHPDLVTNIEYSKSFVPGEAAQYARTGVGSHGTHTAGTVAALDNNIGVVGVAPSAKLLLIKVLRDSGSGAFSWMLEGILDAVNQNADIISMSLGGYLPRNGKFIDDKGTADPSDDVVINDTKAVQDLITTMTHVINYAHRQGVTVIAAAGNSAIDGNQNKSGLTLPGNLPNVICVSATGPMGWASNPATNLDRFASYSNYGTPDITLAGPGGDFALPGNALCRVAGVLNPCWAFDMVLSTGNGTNPTGNYYWSAGTSMATPHVAGVAALIVGKNGGQMDPTRVLAALKASADDLGAIGRDPYYGHGRVNAHKAVMNSGL